MAKKEPYRGTYVTARSASEYIDLDTILSGCDQVDEKASKLSTISNNVKTATSTLDESSFSINKETMLPKIEESCGLLKDGESSIMDTTAQIRAAAEQAYNEIQEQLNYEAEQRDAYERSKNQK